MAATVDPPHDDSCGPVGRNAYMRGCRCTPCRRAQSEYRSGLRKTNNTKTGDSVLKTGRGLLSAVPDVPVQPVQPADDEPVQPRKRVQAPVADPVQPEPAPSPAGSVVAEVQREIDGLASADAHPGLVAAALRMAFVLDTPEAVTQWPQATSRLADLLETLGKGGTKKRGRLAAVRDMTGTGA